MLHWNSSRNVGEFAAIWFESLTLLSLAKEKEKRQLDKQASQLSRDVASIELGLGTTIRGAGGQ